jgi:response regulator RpfG family c-di-GMP phosphodiesterase
MNPKILFVDDDINLLEGIQRALRKEFTIEKAAGAVEGLRKLAEEGPFELIVADMQMPEMSGLEFLRAAQIQAPDSVRIMLTGNADQKTAVDAVNDGRVFRFLTKPCPPPTLVPALEAGLEYFRVKRAERELLENTLGGACKVLTEILALTDPATYEHSQKVREYVGDFIRSTNMAVSWEMELAAMLAQIGRVMIPPAVLEKVRNGLSLTGPERDIVNQVPEFGARMLERIPRLETVADIVRHQAKHFDGTGFPANELIGAEIPIGARILKVLSDLVDCETRSLSRPVAFQQMRERVGWYDLEVLAAVSRWCDVAFGATPANGTGPIAVEVANLRTGNVLAQDLRTADGILIVAAKTKLTPLLLAKLINFRTLNSIDKILLIHAD